MASTSQRRQCLALAMIMMLGVAEAHRVSQHINVAKAAANSEDVNDNALAVFSPRSDCADHIASANEALNHIQNGEGFWGAKYCILSCPGLWIEVAYYQWNMRTAAQSLIAESFGSAQPLTALPDADQEEGKPLATSFHAVMRKSVWTFVKAIDNSVVQRTFLTLLMAPLGLFRTITGMAPLGLCFLKAAWADVHENDPEKYEQSATWWWSGMLSGCPDTPSDAPFENEAKTAAVLDAMVLALSKPEGLGEGDDEAKWAGQETHKQCVDKLSTKGKTQKRELSIEKGIITWRSTEECDSGFFDRVRAGFGHSKSFAMQFLTTPSGAAADLVQFFEPPGSSATACITMQNSHHNFQFCALPGEDMQKAKAVIDAHVSLLGSEKALLDMASKVDRLVAAATFEGEDAKDEQSKLKEEDDETGDTSVESLQGLGDVPSDMEGEEAAEARKILLQVRGASALIATGQDLGNGTALLQEAFAAAHLNQHLSTIMRGKTSQKMGLELSTGNAAAGAGAGITTTELIIIIIVCGGGVLCLGLALTIAGSNLQTSERLEAYEDLKHNSTKVVFPHAPLA